MARFRGGNKANTGQFSVRPTRLGTFVDYLTPSLIAYEIYLIHEINQILREYGEKMVEYAQSHAPWEDRTGDARSGLSFSVEEDPVAPKMYLYHTVDYGVWLEIRWNGRFAIIMPTIETLGPEMMRDLDGRI